MKRRKKAAKRGPHKHDHLDNVSQLSPSVQATEQDLFTKDISEDDTESMEDNVKSIEDGEDDMPVEENITTEENMDIGEDRSVTTADKNLSTDIDANDWYAIEKRITEQQELIEVLQRELRGTRPSIKLQNDDNQVHFYTGLPSYSVFIGLLNLLVGVMSKHLSHGLSVSDQFLMVLMKFRLAVPNQDLAYRFGISTGRVSQLFHKWIDVMARELEQLIRWPHRETKRENLPDCFKATYPKTTCIIDCSKIFIERATSLCARSQTYSNYKSHNTAKFLIAISATGAILLYFAWARSKVKVCYYFHILWRRAVFAQLPENTAHLGKYSTLGKTSFPSLFGLSCY